MASVTSSATHVPLAEDSIPLDLPTSPGRGPSALPEDKSEEILENLEDNWQVALYTFVSPLGSSIMAPGLPQIAIKYGITNETIIAMTLSIFLLSFAIAPLFLAPLSEMYGRKWVLHIGNLCTIAFNLGCAFAPTTGALLGFRFLVGLSGSAPIACGGGVITDLFSERDRGPLIGPVVGPIAGGFIIESIGVRWMFLIVAGYSGRCRERDWTSFLRETYSPVIRKSKKALDPEKLAGRHPVLLREHQSKLHTLWINLSRPAILLFGSLICFMLSLYMAFIYGIYYLMFTTFDTLFSQTYGFSTGTGGLAYIPLGLGFISSTAFSAKAGDKVYHYLSKKNGGKGEPEMRVPSLIAGSFFVPIGVFWYGWSAQAQLHWIMPMIGVAIFGFGMMASFLPIQLYLVDTFSYAASAVAAASVFRSMFGFGFPLFGHAMFQALGTGGGNSLLAGLAIVLGIPFPIDLYYRGAAMRARSKLAR
ncbi:major facilitator superfamily domain-containing protein [Mycena olivaceomarginata]|nr:major facilitator superfamily domain-containing protein [Mycena olivaceomarginata]